MENYAYLRKEKAADMKRMYEAVYEKTDELQILSFLNAVILPCRRDGKQLWGNGGLVDSDGMYITSSGIKGGLTGVYPYDDPDWQDEKVVYCGYLVNHWGHFLVEAVARLWYFLQNDLTVDKYVFFINEGENREIKGNFKEFFLLLGIWDRIEIINKPTRYREVVLPELGCDRTVPYYTKQYKNIFNTICEHVVNSDEGTSPTKIFFTRSQLKSAKKTDIGNDMVDSFFRNNGYEIISPEKISLSNMIRFIRNADEVAVIAGSLEHNMLFADDNKKLIVIERLVPNNEYAALTNCCRNLQVTHIDANICIYSIDLGAGPYFLFYKGMLEKYAQQHGMCSPDTVYTSSGYQRRCFAKYMKIYKMAYGYAWYMLPWANSYIDAYREAYEDSLKYFQEYIYGLKPFKTIHIFQLRYIKQFIKHCLASCFDGNKT